MCVQAGPRAVPDSGPDLIRRRVSDFAAELELPAIPVHHVNIDCHWGVGIMLQSCLLIICCCFCCLFVYSHLEDHLTFLVLTL